MLLHPRGALRHFHPSPPGAETVAAFLRANPEERPAILRVLERQLRVDVGLLPIAIRNPAVSVHAEFQRLRISSEGALRLDDTFLATEDDAP